MGSCFIKDLPPKVRDLALQRMEQSGKVPDDSMIVSAAFAWSYTEEGDVFWSEMDKGWFDGAPTRFPHLAYLFEGSTPAPKIVLSSYYEPVKSLTFEQPVKKESMEILSIKDLPPKLKELASERAITQRGHGSFDENKTVNASMTWCETPEGHSFWDYVNSNNFEAAKEECPHLAHLFDTGSLPLKIGQEEPMLKINVRKKK